MRYLRKRFRFEYSSGNNETYRDNWDAIFGKKEEPKAPPAEDEDDVCEACGEAHGPAPVHPDP